MKRVLILLLLSHFAMGADMSGWNNNAEEEAAKAAKAEQARMCKEYKEKITIYKKTMRKDEYAQATLNNYIRVKNKFCETANK